MTGMVPDIVEKAHENKHSGGTVMIMHDTATGISRTLKNTSA